MLPIHFCFFINDGAAAKFTFVNALAIILAQRVLNASEIRLHSNTTPTGSWWQVVKEYVTLVETTPPANIFGNPIVHLAHMADVVRLEVLQKMGGIYLDLDVWVLRDFSVFDECDCVLGLQDGSYGLCNAVIIAKQNAEFINRWLTEYRDFDAGKWDEHSVRRPKKLAEEFPHLIHIQPETAFFWPPYRSPDHIFFENGAEYRRRHLNNIWAQKRGRFDRKLRQSLRLYFGENSVKAQVKLKPMFLQRLRGSFAIHLWESIWKRDFFERLSPQWLAVSQSVLAIRVREVLGHACVAELSEFSELSELSQHSRPITDAQSVRS